MADRPDEGAWRVMITDWQVERQGDALILGIAIEHAVLDVLTNCTLLASCLAMLETPHTGLINTHMGQFGVHPVSLSLHYDETVSIFIDGPYFSSSRIQSAAIWVDKEKLRSILHDVIRDSTGPIVG